MRALTLLVLAALLAAPAPAAAQAPVLPAGSGGLHVFPPCMEVRFTAEDVTGRGPISFTWVVDTGETYFGNPIDLDTTDFEGFHTLTVTATNPWGSASFATFFEIEVLDVGPPEADQNPTPALTVTVTGSMTGATEWSWSWGDGSATPWRCVEDPTFEESHTYAEPGTYAVRLRGRNCVAGTLAGPPILVSVGDPDAIEVTEFEAQGCVAGFCVFEVGEPILFQQAFTAEPTELRYDWDGDGEVDQVSSSVVPTHAYPGDGTFKPRLTAARGSGQDTFVHEQWLLISGTPTSEVFADGFEAGNLSRWSKVVGTARGEVRR